MPKVTVLDNEFITLWYHPESKIIHHKFHKYIFGEAFREGLNTGWEVMKKYGAQKWLSDDRNNPVLDSADTEWNMAHWLPQVIEAGWKYWAIVQPEEFAAKYGLDALTKELADRGITVRIFNDPEKAMKWLENQ